MLYLLWQPEPEEIIRTQKGQAHQFLKMKLFGHKKVNIEMHDSILTMEYAEYTKSEAPKFTPSKTKANELMG